jgi:hypothetical protein
MLSITEQNMPPRMFLPINTLSHPAGSAERDLGCSGYLQVDPECHFTVMVDFKSLRRGRFYCV